ncbi:MAG: hypothetical protein LH467_09610 [Gemmatimonadaceae bacterium]|nr:hypothetical protein [Gemmatimonadaceae bacterium]
MSPWTLGYILGREWEPYSVVAYNRLDPARTHYRGTYILVDAAPLMDDRVTSRGDDGRRR